MTDSPSVPNDSPIDGRYAWVRLAITLTVAMIGGVGLWSVVVVLPRVEAEFGADRAAASLPYAFTMLGFALGGIMMGRMVDRYGVLRPLIFGACCIAIGYIGTGMAQSLWQFTIGHAILIGLLGSSITFGPLIADVSHWFEKRRGIAVAVAASGSYLAGTVWPPIVEAMMDAIGWRQTHMAIGLFALATLIPLAFLLRRRPPHQTISTARPTGAPRVEPELLDTGLPKPVLQGLLIVAGFACCVAMSMPQVHIVAYCLDLGIDSGRGAEMLSLMLATGIVSRLAFGAIADRIGPFKTLLLASGLQTLALLLFLPFDSLISLYVVSALFGLSQGGIVPTYALIIRKVFPGSQAGTRVSIVLAATMIGMGAGGWISGALYDLTLSYQAAFLNGVAWNVLNIVIAVFLLYRISGTPGGRPAPAAA
ncbi:MAG: MFS transporter [Alphaproteobacteria bacterium]|nr:MFS transporter [Alphaproteobacteria bacterium]